MITFGGLSSIIMMNEGGFNYTLSCVETLFVCYRMHYFGNFKLINIIDFQEL